MRYQKAANAAVCVRRANRYWKCRSMAASAHEIRCRSGASGGNRNPIRTSVTLMAG